MFLALLIFAAAATAYNVVALAHALRHLAPPAPVGFGHGLDYGPETIDAN